MNRWRVAWGTSAVCLLTTGCQDFGRTPAPSAPADSHSASPSITRVYPASTVAGDTVWVNGVRFGDGFGGILRMDGDAASAEATVLAWTDTTIVALVPALSGAVRLVVFLPDEDLVAADFEIDALRRSYARDVETIFRNQQYGCWSCHSGFGSGNLNVVPWADLLSGTSDHGPVISPRFGDDSVLIRKLRGTAGFGEPMPFGGTPLEESVIEIIVEWINQGALND